MMSFVLSLFVAIASAQESPSVYSETKKCFRSHAAFQERELCYQSCKNANPSHENAVECSRMRRDFEKMVLEDQFYERGSTDSTRSILALAQLQCKLHNMRSNDEVKMNECMAEVYAQKDQEMLQETAQAQK